MKMPITPEFTALVTGHRKTKSYLYRFKLADDLTCLCNEGQQTSDHIIFECNIVEVQRSALIKQITVSGGSWPPKKEELITKYLKAFLTYCGPVTQICVFTLQLCKTDDANLRL